MPYINARLERTKLRFQTQATRLDELRTKLDDSVVALSSAEGALENAEASVELAQYSKAPTSARHAATGSIETLREATDEVDKDRQLLAVRLGSRSAVVQACITARFALRELERELEHILATGPEWDDPEDYAEPAQTLAQLREDYARRKEQFLDAASSIVGPDAGEAKQPAHETLVWLTSGKRMDE